MADFVPTPRRLPKSELLERVLHPECHVPPAGWQCTRLAGHAGPCAAISTDPEVAKDIACFVSEHFGESWRDMSPERRQYWIGMVP